MADKVIEKALQSFTDNLIFLGRQTFLVGIGVEAPVLLLKNPAASGKIIRGLILQASTKETTVFMVATYGNPTIIANGTSMAIKSHQFKATPPNSVMELYSQPTITGNGAAGRKTFISDKKPESILNLSRTMIIHPGKDILVTAEHTDSLAAKNVYMFIEWIEVPI